MDDYEYSDETSSPDSQKQPQSIGQFNNPEVDLPTLCQQQKGEIQTLKQQLQQKSKELEDLTRLIRKYTNIIPELKAAVGPSSTDQVKDRSPPKPLDQSGADFWDSHLDRKETNNFSFEDIASKGLWILSSSTQHTGTQKNTKLQELQKAGIRGKGKADKKPESLPPLKSAEITETPPPNKSKLREIYKPAEPTKALISKSPIDLKPSISPDSDLAPSSKKRQSRGIKKNEPEGVESVLNRQIPAGTKRENPNHVKPPKQEKTGHRKALSMAERIKN